MQRPRLSDTIAVRVTTEIGDRIRREAGDGRRLGEVTRRYLEAGIRATDAAPTRGDTTMHGQQTATERAS